MAGDLELRIPKLRTGSFFPALLERRRRVDQCLFAVVMEAYLHGTSTRKVDDLVKALGADSGISKSEVSRICADLDTEVSCLPRSAAVRAGVPLCLPRRDLLQGPRQPPGGVPGGGDRHRRRRLMAAARCWASRSATPAHDEWQVADKRYLSETTLALLTPTKDSDDPPEAVPAAITA